MTSDYGYMRVGATYMHDVHAVCAQTGKCQYSESIKILHAAQELVDRSRRVASEWCEIKTAELPEGHPFNGKLGKVVFERNIWWPDGHTDHSGTITMCIKHGNETGLMPPKGDDDSPDIVNGEITA